MLHVAAKQRQNARKTDADRNAMKYIFATGLTESRVVKIDCYCIATNTWNTETHIAEMKRCQVNRIDNYIYLFEDNGLGGKVLLSSLDLL